MAGDRELIGSMERAKTKEQDGDQDPDQERLAHLTACGIIWESFKLCYWREARYFFAILFTLGVPYLLQFTFSTIFFLIFYPYYVSSLFPPPPPAAPPAPAALSASVTGQYGPVHDQIHLWRTLNVGVNLQILADFLWPVLIIFGAQILNVIVNQVCRALWVAGTTYTVGLSYSRRHSLSSDDLSRSRSKSDSDGSDSPVPVSSFIKDVLRRAPRLWYRLMRTWLWQVFLLAFPVFIFVVSVVAINFGWAIWLFGIPYIFSLVCVFAVSIVGTVAEAATVLDPEESCYGSEAFKKGMTLLKDKWGVAVCVYILWILMSLLVYLFSPISFTTAAPDSDIDPWDPVRILQIVIYCIFQWVVLQSIQASSGVLYASLKAYHGESIVGLSPGERKPRIQTPASRGRVDGWV